jgi:hypothetical protein
VDFFARKIRTFWPEASMLTTGALKPLAELVLHTFAYENGTECSETSAFKLQTPGNHQKKAYDIQNTKKV